MAHGIGLVEAGAVWTVYASPKQEQPVPPVAEDDVARVNSDRVLDALFYPPADSVLANDTDANTGDTLTVVDFGATSEAGATVTMEADGTFTYDPREVPLFQAMTYWDREEDSFTYTISDRTHTATGTVTVEVYGPGQAFEGEPGANLTLAILAPEDGATWSLGETVTLEGETRSPTGAVVSCEGYCVWQLTGADDTAAGIEPASDGSFVVAGFPPGMYTLTYVNDPIHQHAQASVSVTIEAGNLPEQAMLLLDGLVSGDADEDGELSLAEAQAVLAALTAGQFTAIDADNSGTLSEAELAAQIPAGEGEGDGEGERDGIGCNLDLQSLGKKLGDLFLLGIAMLVLAVSRKSSFRNDA